MADEGVKKLQLSWPAALVAQIDAAAAEAKLNRSEWLRKAATTVLSRRIRLGPPPETKTTTGCTHPKADRLQLSYGTRCTACERFV